MAKYSGDFKLQIVKEYLEGSLGYGLLVEKYEIPNRAQIARWVHTYKAFGKEGLRKSSPKKFILFNLKSMYYTL